MKFKGVPLIGFCAWSGTGKTTLLTKVIPLLKQQQLRLAIVKHGHHSCQIDQKGKDSYRYREKGADQIVLATRERVALIEERPEPDDEPSLEEALSVVQTEMVDLILVEGFKHEPYPKIELHRSDLNRPLLFPNDPHVIAVATDHSLDIPTTPPPQQLNLNNPHEVADFIMNTIFPHSSNSELLKLA